MAYPPKRRTVAPPSVHESATPERAPHPAHHVEDRLLPLKQTVRHPLDPPFRSTKTSSAPLTMIWPTHGQVGQSP
jgi:hypothetical protein